MSLYLGTTPIANDGSHRLTGEIGDMGFAPLGIDESLNLRRYLNGQVISQTQFIPFTTKVKAAVALFPSLATTESNWQAEKALSKFGQVGKFVIDDENQTIRLPAVVNAQGLLSLSGIGNLVNESLPNITGSLISSANYPNYNWTASATDAFTMSQASTTNSISATATEARNRNSNVYFNASGSSSTYQTDAPVQQEAVQYPYYIQVATGTEERLPAIREYEINTPFFFGQSMYSENAPYNASWLASNGQYNASTLYPDFWTQLTGVELNSSLNVGDTIEISGKSYVKRGLPVVLSTGTITDYDFVVNQNDQTFRLPLLNGEEDLPTTSYDELTLRASGSTYTAPANGFFYLNKIAGSDFYYTQIETVKNGNVFRRIFVSEYQKSPCTFLYPVRKDDVVQITYNATGATNAFRFFYAEGNGTLYYYVGDTVQDASLINAGAVLGQLSNKADIDLSNVNNTGNAAALNLNSKGIRTVVETYKNGSSWYRVWSDGWCEQGGEIPTGTDLSLTTIIFLKPFADTNYLFLRNLALCNNSYTYYFFIGFDNKTATSVQTGVSSGRVGLWYACGYIR